MYEVRCTDSIKHRSLFINSNRRTEIKKIDEAYINDGMQKMKSLQTLAILYLVLPASYI
jgi:hypothetical protein